MTRIGAVSPEVMQQIVDKLNRQTEGGRAQMVHYQEDGIFFLNTTGEEIPPYGVFQGHDTKNVTFMSASVIAKKPIDATANASAIFVNGPNAVENNGFGYAQPGPIYKVLHDGTAAAGDDLGLADDSFEASPGSGPFVAIGEDDVAPNVFLCLLAAGSGSGLRMFKTPSGGIAAASGSTPGSATCTEYPNGMAGSPGAPKTVKNHRTSIIPGEVFILVQAFGADLYCVEGNCPNAGGIIEEP